REGSLILSHARDIPYFQSLTQRIVQQAPTEAWQWARVAELEPELGHSFERGLFLPGEAHLDNRALLPALIASLEAGGVRFRFGEEILEPGSLSPRWVIDCRGISAQKDESELRGVRGEALLLHAPDVTLHRPVRLMHPRYAVYIVPRADQIYYLGATSIEGSSAGAVTVRSALELLSAAFSIHGGFAEATILELLQGIRPAYLDHRPRIVVRGRVIVMNGLYRHGFLLSPVLANRLRLFLEDRQVPHVEHLFHFA
ncbi:MAG: FAD-dependent oxidoreductase, partial [Oligoflexus sp.]